MLVMACVCLVCVGGGMCVSGVCLWGVCLVCVGGAVCVCLACVGGGVCVCVCVCVCVLGGWLLFALLLQIINVAFKKLKGK